MVGEERERETRLILDVIRQERDAVEKGDIAPYVAALADDAVFMPPNTAAKEGLELRTWLGDFLESTEVAWLGFAPTDVVVVGDLACHAFTYTWRVTPRTGGGSTVGEREGPSRPAAKGGRLLEDREGDLEREPRGHGRTLGHEASGRRRPLGAESASGAPPAAGSSGSPAAHSRPTV